MQPYFLPYIGYFQLIAGVDMFIIYDNIKYTKKGWINRNRMLLNGKDAMFSLPLKNASDSLDIRERELTEDFNQEKLLSQFKGAYRQAPQFAPTIQLLERIVRNEEKNLFRFLHHSIVKTCDHLEIKTEIKISSDIAIDHDLKSQDKVLALCEAVGATKYVNTIGGVELYSKETFMERGIDLKFIQSKTFEYPQLGDIFVPWLSMIDVMMFNPLNAIQDAISSNYVLS